MARLAKDVLAEIPDQFLLYMRSRGFKPFPAPPPYTPTGHLLQTQIWLKNSSSNFLWNLASCLASFKVRCTITELLTDLLVYVEKHQLFGSRRFCLQTKTVNMGAREERKILILVKKKQKLFPIWVLFLWSFIFIRAVGGSTNHTFNLNVIVLLGWDLLMWECNSLVSMFTCY